MSVTDDPTSPSPSHAASPSDRPPRRAATRDRLRTSGIELFAQRGLHGITTHDIAHNAGLAAGTFYLHFSDKQSLFREIVLEAMDELRGHLLTATQSAEAGDSARAYSTALVDFAARNGALIRVLFSGDGDASALEHDVLNTFAESLSKTRIQRGGVPAGANPAVFGQALVGMFARVVAWWVEDPNRATREEVIETLTRIQLTGTQPD